MSLILVSETDKVMMALTQWLPSKFFYWSFCLQSDAITKWGVMLHVGHTEGVSGAFIIMM